MSPSGRSPPMAMLAVLAALSVASTLVAAVPSQVTHGSIRPAHFGDTSRFARRGLSSPHNAGEMTFYDVGLGACELRNTNSEFVGALNAPDFGPAWPPRNSPACSSCVLISAPDVPSKPAIKVRIVDKCPECKPGDIDVSPTVFEHFFHKDKGRARITWNTVPCSGDAAPPQRPPVPVPAPVAPVVPKPPQVPAPAPPQAPKPSPTTPPHVPDAQPTVAPPQRPKPQPQPQPQPPVAPVVPSPPAPPKVEPTRPPQNPIAEPIPTAAPVPVQPPQGGNGGNPGKGKGGSRRKCRPRNRSQSPVQSA